MIGDLLLVTDNKSGKSALNVCHGKTFCKNEWTVHFARMLYHIGGFKEWQP